MTAIKPPQKIAIIRRNRLGDMICTLPLIDALRQKFPSARLVVLSDAAGCEVARWSTAVNEVYQVRRPFLRFLSPWINRQYLKDCDVVIGVKGGWDRSLARMVGRSKAPMRIGFDPNPSSDFYTHPLPLPEYEHQIKTLFRLLKPLGINPPERNRFDLDPPKASTDDLIKKTGVQDLLLTLTCNRGQYWSFANYYSLIDRLQKAGTIQVSVMKRPEDLFSWELEEELANRGVKVLTPKTLAAAARYLQQADGFISPEGGLVHLAASVGTKTIVLWRKNGVIQKWGSTAATHFDLQPPEGIENLSTETMIEEIQRRFKWNLDV